MSKYNNVNPDHYKVAGRERPGNAVAKAPKTEAELEKTRARWFERQRREQKAPNKEGAGTRRIPNKKPREPRGRRG